MLALLDQAREKRSASGKPWSMIRTRTEDSPDVYECGARAPDQKSREHEPPVVGSLVGEREQERSTCC
jgi:hypothetical protein